jgi:hypothetical protein
VSFEEWWAEYVMTLGGPRPELRTTAKAAWEAATLLADRPIQLVGVHYNPEEFHEGQP